MALFRADQICACLRDLRSAYARIRRRASGIVRAADVRGLFPHSVAGLAVLGAGTDADEQSAAPPELWRSAVDPVDRFFDVVVTDWGVRTHDEDLAQIAQAHHVVAVTARADRGCAERGLAFAARLAALAPATRVALILVDLGATGGSTTALVERQVRSSPHAPWVAGVPHEPRLGAGVHLDDAAPLTLAARCAYARVAAGLLSLSRDPATPDEGVRPAATCMAKDGA